MSDELAVRVALYYQHWCCSSARSGAGGSGGEGAVANKRPKLSTLEGLVTSLVSQGAFAEGFLRLMNENDTQQQQQQQQQQQGNGKGKAKAKGKGAKNQRRRTQTFQFKVKMEPGLRVGSRVKFVGNKNDTAALVTKLHVVATTSAANASMNAGAAKDGEGNSSGDKESTDKRPARLLRLSKAGRARGAVAGKGDSHGAAKSTPGERAVAVAEADATKRMARGPDRSGDVGFTEEAWRAIRKGRGVVQLVG